MGVTLERVQHKFACIIGELCGEPKILSQFAVWIDLRLAEYKSKGSISLECSGCVPEPSWLEGLTVNNFTPYVDPSQAYSRTNPLNSFSPRSPSNQNALGAVIKTEPLMLDEVVPVHSHSSRKRSFDACVPFGLPFDGPSMTKLSKSSHNQQQTVSSPRQSRVASVTSPTQSESFQESPSNTSDIDMAQSIINNIKNDSLPNPVFPNSRGPSAENKVFEASGEQKTFGTERLFHPWSIQRSMYTHRVGHSEIRNEQTLRNIMSAAATFERWLAAKNTEEQKPMEQIEPVTLDEYLADFFITVKKRSGQDYNADTLLSLRSNIERYLREKGYPCSITKSEVFTKSQLAFKTRRQVFGSNQRTGPIGHAMYRLGLPGSLTNFPLPGTPGNISTALPNNFSDSSFNQSVNLHQHDSFSTSTSVHHPISSPANVHQSLAPAGEFCRSSEASNTSDQTSQRSNSETTDKTESSLLPLKILDSRSIDRKTFANKCDLENKSGSTGKAESSNNRNLNSDTVASPVNAEVSISENVTISGELGADFSQSMLESDCEKVKSASPIGFFTELPDLL